MCKSLLSALRFGCALGALSLLATASAVHASEPAVSGQVNTSPTSSPTRLDPGCHLPDNGALSHVVQLLGDNGGHASGVVIRKNLLLTVAHALAGEDKVYAEIDGELSEVSPVAINESRDLALVAVDTRALQPIEISRTPLQQHERVWAIGFPLGKSQRTSHGILTEKVDGNLYTSAHINQGSSGGGLYRCANGGGNRYELAGIVRAYVADISSDTPVNTGDSVAVGSSAIQDILEIVDRERFSLANYQPDYATEQRFRR